MPKLVFARHGQSEWNLQNRFTGWVDVDLTDKGVAEARKAGQLMKAEGLTFDRGYTSVQTRAIRTMWLALEEMGTVYLDITKHYRLNERHYGALSGLNKQETRDKHGDEQVHIWRRSYDVPPPMLKPGEKYHPSEDPRYAHIDPAELPGGESLKMTLGRVLPYWWVEIAPRVVAGENIIISAHGNSLRALVKHLFDVSDDEIPGFEIPTGNPLLMEIEEGTTKVKFARYLDADRAKEIPPLA